MSDSMTDKNVAQSSPLSSKSGLATTLLMPVTRLVSRPSSIEVVNGELVPVRALIAAS
jgi:hypothetical protein